MNGSMMMKGLLSILVGASLFAAGPARAVDDYYVSQRAENASDENPGTLEQPFKTINGALKAVGPTLKPGDHVWVLDGVYKEGLSLWPVTAEKVPHAHGIRIGTERVTLAGYPGHTPMISGSVKLDGWAPFRDKVWVTDFAWVKHQPFPVVFVDGKPLQQIAGTVETNPERWNGRKGESLSDLEAGSFFYDEIEKKLYAWLADGGNPADHELETYDQQGRRGVHIGAGLRHFTLKDLTVRHAGLSVWGDFTVVQNIDQAWGSFIGCYLRGPHSLILDSAFDWNGNSGMGGGPIGIRIVKCRTNHNNWRGWSGGWHAGGVKFLGNDSWVLQGHTAAFNNGDGIWFDSAMVNVTIENCVSYRNKGAGIHYEIGTRGVIRNNICYENGARGIYLSNASHTTVINNLVYRNGLSGIVSIGIVRGETCGAHNVIWGNILMDNCHPDFAPQTTDGRGQPWTSRPELIMPHQLAQNMGNVSDFNIFYRFDGRAIPFWGGWHEDLYDDLAAWREATGNDKNSIIARPLFVDEAHYDFRPATNSPALWMITRQDPAGRLDAAGIQRDRSLRTAGPFEGNLDQLKRLRDDLPLGKHLLFPWPNMAVKVTGTPNPKKVYASRTLSGILKSEDLGYKVMGWKVRDIPFLPNSGLASVSLHLDGDAPSAGLRLGRPVKRLHLLLNADGMAPGRPFAACAISRDDGHTRRIEWTADEKGVISSAPADSTRTEHGLTGRRSDDAPEYSFYVTTWENDNEWLPVSTLQVELLDSNATLRIMGITGERVE